MCVHTCCRRLPNAGTRKRNCSSETLQHLLLTNMSIVPAGKEERFTGSSCIVAQQAIKYVFGVRARNG
jgi:hypothetical protein